jgi:glycosyltransferase involved in cell wall biosynthesis
MLDLLTRLDRAKLSALVVTSAGGPLVDRVKALGLPVELLELDAQAVMLSREAWHRNPLSFFWRARGYLGAVTRLIRVVKEQDVRFLHTNTLKAHVIGSLVAFGAGKPIVWHMRDLPSSRGDARSLLAGLFRLVKPGIVAISQAVADDLPAAMRARTRVVYNGVDLDRFAQLAAPEPVDFPWPEGDGPLIGTVSHLIPWKGQEVFVRAAAILLKSHPTWRFVLVGDDIFQFQGERARLTALTHELGIADRVVLVGNREDVPAILKRLSLFVLPSLYEPFGRVLIEAMAAGLPIVASRAGGVPEIVVDGETGILVEPGYAEPMAEAIAALLTDPARAKAMADAGRARVEGCFSLEATVRGVMDGYKAWGLVES